MHDFTSHSCYIRTFPGHHLGARLAPIQHFVTYSIQKCQKLGRDLEVWRLCASVRESWDEVSVIAILSLRHVLPQACQAGSVWGVSDADLLQGSHSAVQSDQVAEDKRLPSNGREVVQLFVIGHIRTGD